MLSTPPFVPPTQAHTHAKTFPPIKPDTPSPKAILNTYSSRQKAPPRAPSSNILNLLPLPHHIHIQTYSFSQNIPTPSHIHIQRYLTFRIHIYNAKYHFQKLTYLKRIIFYREPIQAHTPFPNRTSTHNPSQHAHSPLFPRTKTHTISQHPRSSIKMHLQFNHQQ